MRRPLLMPFILLLSMAACDDERSETQVSSATIRPALPDGPSDAVRELLWQDDRAGLEAYLERADKPAGDRAHAAVALFSVLLTRDADETEKAAALLKKLPAGDQKAVLPLLRALLLRELAKDEAGRHIAAGTNALLDAGLAGPRKDALAAALLTWTRAQIASDKYRAARYIAARGTAEDKKAASKRLEESLKDLDGEDWPDAQRKLLRKANARAGLPVTEEQLEAQLLNHRAVTRKHILSALNLIDPEAAERRIDAAAEKGKTHVGKAAVSGQVDGAAKVVAGMQDGFHRCYAEGLSRNPKLQGAVVLNAKLADDGTVVSVSGGGADALASIMPCIEGVVVGVTFSAPSGGSAILTIPIIFTAKSSE